MSLSYVCLFSISEKSNSFLRWLQSLAAYLRNIRKSNSYHPWPVISKAATIITREDGQDGWFSRNNPLSCQPFVCIEEMRHRRHGNAKFALLCARRRPPMNEFSFGFARHQFFHRQSPRSPHAWPHSREYYWLSAEDILI